MVKLRGRVLSLDATECSPGAITQFAPGAIRVAARDIPVTGFDSDKVIGRATVYIDGTADLEIEVPQEQRLSHGDPDLGIGFVVEKQRYEGAVRIIEQLRPLSLSVSSDLLRKLEGK